MDVKIRVCLPRKYGCFMLLIDNNLLLPGARLHILNNILWFANTNNIYILDYSIVYKPTFFWISNLAPGNSKLLSLSQLLQGPTQDILTAFQKLSIVKAELKTIRGNCEEEFTNVWPIYSIHWPSHQSRKLWIWIHRTFGPVNCEELQDRTRFYRTDNKIMIFF